MKCKSIKIKLIATLFISMSLWGCSGNKEKTVSGIWGADPKNAECIYGGDASCDSTLFKVMEEEDEDGSRCVVIEHLTSPLSEHYRLLSPNGNLRIFASGAQEACGLGGYRIDYDEKGRVCNVMSIGSLDDEEYRKIGKESSVKVMKRWLEQSLNETPAEQHTPFICRNDRDEIISIGGIRIPSGYKPKYYIREWGPFWESDLNGGHLGFFVVLENVDTADGSYVNYMYCNGKFIAELAYWKGVFIKARTYNKMGVMVNLYTDRSIDVANQAFYDQRTNPVWYVDN